MSTKIELSTRDRDIRRPGRSRLNIFAIIVGLAIAGTVGGVAWGWSSSSPTVREIHITARQFAYDPGVIRVNLGDRVVLHVESADVTHGLYVDGYGVQGKVTPGEDLTLEFVADRAGRFGIRCTEVCGVFHPFMTGKLIVEPNLLFPGSIGLALGAASGAVVWAGWSARR
ncbi:MAG: cupredoxin domain-containing protein [Acidimicrobiia bacterium]